jgi:hypothetical protein
MKFTYMLDWYGASADQYVRAQSRSASKPSAV